MDVAGWCSELTLDDPLCDPSTSTPRPLDVGLYTAYVKGLDVPSTPRHLDPSTYPSTPLEAPDRLVTLEPPSTPRPSNPSTTPRRTPRPLDGQGSRFRERVAFYFNARANFQQVEGRWRPWRTLAHGRSVREIRAIRSDAACTVPLVAPQSRCVFHSCVCTVCSCKSMFLGGSPLGLSVLAGSPPLVVDGAPWTSALSWPTTCS